MKGYYLIITIPIILVLVLMPKIAEADFTFSDDFNDGVIDVEKWQSKYWDINRGWQSGGAIKEIDGVLDFHHGVMLGEQIAFNFKIEVDFKISKHFAAFVFKATDEELYMFQVTSYENRWIDYTPNEVSWRFQRYSSSFGPSQRSSDSAPFPIHEDKWYHLRLEGNNGIFRAYINDTLVSEYRNKDLGEGKIGFFGKYDRCTERYAEGGLLWFETGTCTSHAQFDNLEVIYQEQPIIDRASSILTDVLSTIVTILGFLAILIFIVALIIGSSTGNGSTGTHYPDGHSRTTNYSNKKKGRRRKYCSKCGKQLSDSGCMSCGASLAEQGKEIPQYEQSWWGRYHSTRIRVDKPYLERKRRAEERKKARKKNSQ